VTTGYTDTQGLLRRQAEPFERVLGTAVSEPDYWWVDWVNQVDPALQTVYTYDPFGRLTDTETIADDSSPSVLWNTSVDYDVVTYASPFRGVEQTMTDEEGDIVDHISDVYGNLAKVIEHDGSTLISTVYGYDGAGRLKTVTNSGDTTSIGYDYAGRKTSLVDPDMGSWSYTYDLFGNLATQTDGRGDKLAFAYDQHNRLERKHRNNTTSGYKLAEWFYDANGQVGLLDRSVAYEDPDGNAVTDYTVTVDPQGYDARNRVTSTTWTIDGSTYTVGWTYDEADRVDTITYPTVGANEETVTYGYDDSNRGLPSGLTSNRLSSDIVSAVSWNELGAPLAATFGSGGNAVARVWEYQTDTLRLNKLEAGVGASSTNRQNLQYSYYDDGNVQWIKDYGNSSQRQCFEYDDLSRLTDAYSVDGACAGIANWSSGFGVGPYRRQYRYENNGNIDEVLNRPGFDGDRRVWFLMWCVQAA
jgi:YD repeat-containing protein